MTYNAFNTRLPHGASNPSPARRDASGSRPFAVWQAVRQAFHLVSDVVAEASRLRHSLHRKHMVVEE